VFCFSFEKPDNGEQGITKRREDDVKRAQKNKKTTAKRTCSQTSGCVALEYIGRGKEGKEGVHILETPEES
jgi:hypothetical protein